MGIIRILLADDHRMVREGLRALLNAAPECTVVGEASDGLEAVDAAVRTRPSILVTDLKMPRLCGVEVVRRVLHVSRYTRAIVLSMFADESYVIESLRAGAHGYVLKESDGSVLLEAVREVAAGRYFLGPPLDARAIEFYASMTKTAPTDAYDTLTSREREILQLTAEGRTRTEIATGLSVSPRTVEVHRSNLMRKLNLANRAELVRYAIRRGIIPLEPSSTDFVPRPPAPSSPST